MVGCKTIILELRSCKFRNMNRLGFNQSTVSSLLFVFTPEYFNFTDIIVLLYVYLHMYLHISRTITENSNNFIFIFIENHYHVYLVVLIRGLSFCTRHCSYFPLRFLIFVCISFSNVEQTCSLITSYLITTYLIIRCENYIKFTPVLVISNNNIYRSFMSLSIITYVRAICSR